MEGWRERDDGSSPRAKSRFTVPTERLASKIEAVTAELVCECANGKVRE